MREYMQKLLSGFIVVSFASLLLVEASLKIKGYYEDNNYLHESNSAYNKKYFPNKDVIIDYCESDSPCLKPSGLSPNPLDCCSFYNCDKCRAFLQKCGKGTHFSPKLKVCDYPQTAGCKAQNTYCHKKHYVKTQYIDPRWN